MKFKQDKMEGKKIVSVPIALKGGGNYLLWSRLVKTAIGRLGLWSHITDESPKPVVIEGEGGRELEVVEENKWVQEDLMVLSVLKGSLEVHLLEAYSYCEAPKHMWETLHKTFGNITNLSRVFELKRVINTLMQEEEEFTKHLGKYRSLWTELEILRPNTTDQEILMERREQDQVFGMLLTLNPAFSDVIKHILRSTNHPFMRNCVLILRRRKGRLVSLMAKKTYQWLTRPRKLCKLTRLPTNLIRGSMVRIEGLEAIVIIARSHDTRGASVGYYTLISSQLSSKRIERQELTCLLKQVKLVHQELVQV